MTLIPILDVGGTHATAALVDAISWTVRPDPVGRMTLRGDAPADELLDALAACVLSLGPVAGTTLAVAIPGPFDYATGIGRFRDVGKFDALDGVDVARHSPHGCPHHQHAWSFSTTRRRSGWENGSRAQHTAPAGQWRSPSALASAQRSSRMGRW